MNNKQSAHAQTGTRESGIELLKIIAIFIIVINHVTQTLGTASEAVAFQDYVILLGHATTDIPVVILMLLRQGGALGNTIFFVCSAWFLVGKTTPARKKAFLLLCTVWSVSILVFCLYVVLYPECLTVKDIIMQIFPTIFSNNWYMTCYIIFLFIYPLINQLISIIDQKQLLRIVLFTSILWIGIDYIFEELLFPSRIIIWITIYFMIVYLKLYCAQLVNKTSFGVILLTVGIMGYVAQVVITNYVGLHINALSGSVLRWNTNCSPFNIMIAIGALALAQKISFTSKLVNYISGLSLFVYLFHENRLFRTYTRPMIWQYLYLHYGYDHVILLVFLYAIVLFMVSIVVSIVYKLTLYRLVKNVSEKIYKQVSKVFNKYI